MYFLTVVALCAVEASLGRIRSCQAKHFGARSRKKLAADSNQVISLCVFCRLVISLVDDNIVLLLNI